MFKEEITKEGNVYIVTVSIQERKYAVEDKLIYQGDPRDLIPSEDRNKVTIIQSPKKKISNMKKEKFQNFGVWKYQIVEVKNQPKPARRRKPRKQSTITSKSDILDNSNK